MEISEECGDDQGSGWLQVKKKHRSNSKLLVQSWAGGLKGKHTPQNVRGKYAANKKGRISQGKQRSNYPKAAMKVSVDSQKNAVNSTSAVNEEEGSVFYHDKCVVNQEDQGSKSPTLVTVDVEHCKGETVVVKEDPQLSKSETVLKIKWGDLEEDALLVDCKKSVGAGSVSGGLRTDNMAVNKNSDSIDALLASNSSCEPQQNKLVEISVDLGTGSHQAPSFACKEWSSEENCKLVNELSATDVKLSVIDDRKVGLGANPSNGTVLHENLKLNNDSSLNPIGEKAVTSTSISHVGDLEFKALVVDEGADATTITQGSELNLDKKGGFKMSGASIMGASLEGSWDLQDDPIHSNLSKTLSVATIGEGDAGEGKERFRERLWCFLFENLNRAVDELYLLCELECDLEQMNEVVLVLEEASSDFKELSSRVEEFDNMKRVSSQSTDGVSMAIKTEHRRPHALSWEVRRMTTSPHRAEILSSSLETFKKIQQERASIHLGKDVKTLGTECPKAHYNMPGDTMKKFTRKSVATSNSKDSIVKLRKLGEGSDLMNGSLLGEKRNIESSRACKVIQNGQVAPQNSSTADSSSTRTPSKDCPAVIVSGKSKKEQTGSEVEKLFQEKDVMLAESIVEKNLKYTDHVKRQTHLSEKDKDKELRNSTSRMSMDAWKEKRNWEDILASPFRVSSRVSYSPGLSRKSAERARILHDKLMSPEKRKKTALDLKREAEEKHARATRIRNELENERVQKLQRTSEKLNRVNEWQAFRSLKLREGMYARRQRSESRHEAFLAQVVRRAGDESSKVNEVRFITSLNEENKKLMLRQKLHDSELRRAEKLQVIKTKQKEDMAREEAVLERRKLLEAEKLQRLAETQRKKDEAQLRREEERKASSAAREAKAVEQLRRKEARAKAQQEEAELLAQKLAERLSESEQRRKFYLEQIRERASMDFRDQSSPLLRNSINRENQGRSTPTNSGDDCQGNDTSGLGGSTLAAGTVGMNHPLKRRIKKIRQRLMALKHEFLEPPAGAENVGIGYRTSVGTARAKIARWLQELQRLRQARNEGSASIGLITAEMIKFLDGKEPELHASRQAGLLDFIASALPASHTSKPEACQVTIYLLRLLRVVLSISANRGYFLAQNLLPPIIPMLSAALENYIKIAASLNVPSTNTLPIKMTENFESVSEIVDGFFWTVATIIGHISTDERQLQMQDVLLELVVVYQVIHRLRDFFALYDRPQVERSPFPSSIILSLKLLVVLTSRPGPLSSIDWESSPVETVILSELEEARPVKSTDFGNSSGNDCSGDNRTRTYTEKCSMMPTLPDVPEDRPLDELCKADRNDKSVFIDKVSEDLSDNSNVKGTLDEIRRKPVEDTAKWAEIRKGEMRKTDLARKNLNGSTLKHSVASLLSAISETGLVCLPSLLTAVLLQANNKVSSEQASYVLPSNFEEVATGVLKILNNLALLDITFVQRMLSRSDLKVEFFHLMSFLLSHCTNNWRKATDQVGLLLLESLLLLGYFSLFHPENQAVLRWGKSPTILHKVCDLPFVFFSDPELMPVLAGTLVAACYGCEQNKDVIQQEISPDMILSLIRSCRNVSASHAIKLNHAIENPPTDVSGMSNNNLLGTESKKLQAEIPLRSTTRSRSNRTVMAKGVALGNSGRIFKARNQRDNSSKATKTSEETALKHNFVASDTSSLLMLYCRFPGSFVVKAEQFFSPEISMSAEHTD